MHLANSLAVLAELESDDYADAPEIHPVAWEVTRLDRVQALELAPQARAAAEDVKALFQLPGRQH